MIKNHERFFEIFTLFIFLLLVTGCGKKEENGEVQKQENSQSTAIDTTKKISQAPKDTTSDITGNWAGTFDQRSATLSVIKQTGKDFSAIMTINYRQPLNKTINGTIEGNTINMQDINASKYLGEYTAQLADNGKTIRGTFNLKAGGKSYMFTLRKK